MPKPQDKPKKKGYDFTEVEPKILELWEKLKIYKFDSKTKKPIYSLDTPPPTVSGRLHMGHAFGDAQQDCIARYKRMQGFEVLNPFGTDNNGLPTLRLIEKEKNVSSKSMSREDFIELCNKTINEDFIPTFVNDAKRLGMSADWDIFYSTIDKHSRKISQKSFIDLYKMGREYREDSPSLWCTKCQTTVAQVELEDKEVESTFNDVALKVGGKNLVISTTRPELFPASVAVFYNPSDKRYKHLKSKKAKIPLFDIEVPILEDERADPEKGTGIAYSATFGDQMDMEWQKEYKLPIKMAIGPNGKMTKLAGKYEGLKVKEAREEILKDLKEAGFLVKQEKITHPVNVHERCGTEIEFIKSKQWFVKYLDLKKDMLKWGKQIKWYPKHMRQRYENWVNGLKWDWCISRQIPFGIPFPVWYCEDCDEVILAQEEQLPIDPVNDKPPIKECPKCKSKKFIPEKDVMNTWATSALTPTITKELLVGTPAYEKINDKPMSIRRNGHDIITFWDFNTIVKSQLHYKMNPWEELYINGWILGADGKKMSKSKGNVVSPQKVIEEFGADALRYLSVSTKLGEDLPFPEKELRTGKKTVTKLWNASKFVFMSLEDYDGKKPKQLEKIDAEFLLHLENLINKTTNYFETYNYSQAKSTTEKFFWNDLADNYIEIVKKRIYNDTGDKKTSAQYVLYQSLLTILKLFAPIMPFVTEEIYQTYFRKTEKTKSIHISSWPESKEKTEPSKPFTAFCNILSNVRQAKTKSQKSMNSEITLTLSKEDQKSIESMLEDFKSVVNAKEIKEGKFKVEFI